MAENGPDIAPRQPTSALWWAIPIGVMIAAVAVLSAATGLEPAVAVAIGAGIAAAASLWKTPKLAVPMLLLSVLSWTGHKSELDPLLLWQNREQAAEYVFGKDLSEEQITRLEEGAERVLNSGLTQRAEQQVREELELAPGDPKPEGYAQQVEQRAAALRSVISAEQWERDKTREVSRQAEQVRGGYFPPETEPGALRGYADALLETVAIAVWGTALAVVIALPVSFLGAKKTLGILSPGEGIGRRLSRGVGTFFTRRGFDACRGFNEFVLALIFVAVLGLGPFAGVLALAVHTFGVLGKVFSDAIEAVRNGEIEGVAATGAGPYQTISFAVVPQIMPYVVSQSLLRFESNVRSASVLGLVGAGGIGFLIDAKIKSYQFQEVATMMILIIIVVSIIDFLCGRVMRKFV